MKVHVEVSAQQVAALIIIAKKKGFQRPIPEEQWRANDYSEAIKHALQAMIQDATRGNHNATKSRTQIQERASENPT